MIFAFQFCFKIAFEFKLRRYDKGERAFATLVNGRLAGAYTRSDFSST
jgi:hypothetical protein